MSSDSLPVRIGDVVAGKYRIERVLGRGGMGFVVAATHLQLDQKVALKFLLPEVAANPEVVSRFVREARAAVKIQSEHVARVLDVGSAESGAPFMVMEYLRGTDLAQLVEGRGALAVPEAVGYVLQACEAIAEAHSVGVVHRDLKPANLFLAERPSGKPMVKVLDFGISKAPMSMTDAALTKPTTMMGSPSYMSPEQMVAAETVDVRTDIWALGVVLYELLTGRLPFVANTMPELVGAVLQRTPEPIAMVRDDVPSEIQAIVDRCLSKERDGRYPNVAELAAALAPLGPPRSDLSLERILHVLGLAPASVRAPARVAVGSAAARPGETFSPTFNGVQRSRSRAWWWMPLAAVVAGGAAIAMLAVGRSHSTAEPPRAEAAIPPAAPTPTPEAPATLSPTRAVAPTAAPSSNDSLLADVPAVVDSGLPSHPPRAEKAAAPHTSVAPAVAAPDCRVVSYFDAEGNKHFKKECR
jgi:serine/threonine-protein kinase